MEICSRLAFQKMIFNPKILSKGKFRLYLLAKKTMALLRSLKMKKRGYGKRTP